MTGYELRAVQESSSVEEIYRWKEDCSVHFMKKKLEGLRIPPFQEKIKQKVVRKTWRWPSLTIFHQEGHPGKGPERVRCTNCRRSPWPHLSRHVVTQKMIIALSSACAQSRWQRAVDRVRRVQLIELAACERYPAQFSYLPSVTGHTWRENAPPPQSPQKCGVVDIGRIPKALPLVLILGRRADHHMIFQIFFYTFFTMGFS